MPFFLDDDAGVHAAGPRFVTSSRLEAMLDVEYNACVEALDEVMPGVSAPRRNDRLALDSLLIPAVRESGHLLCPGVHQRNLACRNRGRELLVDDWTE